ncbi:unnamed protein product [Urochloa decumbens]|uniref:Glycosyltransferase n=1 Tax=Urochloa decumbens TaxID=240449 RepID=A0ABC8XMA3_9POAL
MPHTQQQRARATAPPLHLVFVPFLARSHFAPLAAKAAAASRGEHGVSTTAAIVTTAHFAALAPPSVPVHVADDFRCLGGHEDFSLLPEDSSSSAPAFFAAAEAALAPALAAALRAHADGPAAVVSDAVLYWAPRVARECGVPHVTFHTIGAFAAAAMVALHLHRPSEAASFPDGDPFVVPGGFPRHVKLSRAQVNEEALAHLPIFRAAEAESSAVAFNSFSALEADFAAYYQTHLTGQPKNVFLVGPTRAAAVSPEAKRDPILRWLDGRPAGSVVYVCFGSTCAFGEGQLRELAAGLRASGRPFLWVIPAAGGGAAREERASSHGMVVAGRWAPQAEILAHSAVGGFVTHCGWNSAMEAVCAGVPLATWPLRAEQFVNEAFLVKVLRVGVRVREEEAEDGVEAVVPAGAVARAVGRLMGDGGHVEVAVAVAARRARARELGAAARAAVAVGGSSCADWARMVEQLKALHGSKSDPPM